MFDWITSFIDRASYLGIALLMFLENLFPPIPSEVIMPAAGYDASAGRLSLPLVIIAGSLGSLCGNMFWYGVGRWVGGERLKRWAGRHGRWLTIAPSDVDRIDDWFKRHCGKAVLIGQVIPSVRTLISVPAGMFRMAPARFLLFAAIGTLVWTSALAFAGYGLGANFKEVGTYMNPITNGVLVLIVLVYFYRVITWKGGPREQGGSR
ncbi:MAG TPA: DedA family protein [Allosphingosinicella sp.]|jgi:membrane protein DedA with SNARE-associated domain